MALAASSVWRWGEMPEKAIALEDEVRDENALIQRIREGERGSMN